MGRGSMIWIIIFLKVLAANNDGIYSRIKEMQCDTQLAQHFEILSKPMLKNIAIDYNEAVRVTNTEFNALYAGNDIIICGQLKNKKLKTMKVSITASCGKDHFEKEMCVDIDCQTFDCDIERIWAYLTLKQCTTKRLMIEGMNDDETKQNDQDMAMDIAMKYKFVTPWTSMIVVQSKEQSNKSTKKRKTPKPIPTKPTYNPPPRPIAPTYNPPTRPIAPIKPYSSTAASGGCGYPYYEEEGSSSCAGGPYFGGGDSSDDD